MQVAVDNITFVLTDTSSSKHLHVTYRRFDNEGARWRVVYKSLTVIEFLLKRGSEEFIKVAWQDRDLSEKITAFHSFQYMVSPPFSLILRSFF